MNPHYREIPQASYLLIKLLFFLQESKYTKTLPKINISKKKKKDYEEFEIENQQTKNPTSLPQKNNISEICVLNMGRAGK